MQTCKLIYTNEKPFAVTIIGIVSAAIVCQTCEQYHNQLICIRCKC